MKNIKSFKIFEALSPHGEICDKLGNPIDALDNYLQMMDNKDTEEWKMCDKLIEEIKTIFHEFRQKDAQ